MINESQEADFYANINKIVNFFRRTSHSGFLFCLCNNGEVIKHINQQIIERTEHLNLKVTSLYVSSDNSDNFPNLLRETAHKNPNGIIINNLDELIIISKGDFVKRLNFAREILIDLNLPLLFWFSGGNISLIANKATDLFIRRDRSVIVFSDVTGTTKLKRLRDFYVRDQKSKEKYDDLNIKIELLEKQLEEGLKRGYSEKRIATEIVADLINLYLDAYLIQEAHSLFENYKKYYEENENVRFMDLCAKMYERIYKWDKALEYYLKSVKIKIEVEDRVGLAYTYFNIGSIYADKGEWDKALEYYLKSEEITTEVRDRVGLGTNYNNIGLIYSKKGEWNKALEYYLKSVKIKIEVEDRAGLGPTYNNIGLIYSKKEEWDKALEYYLKSEEITIEAGDRVGLGPTYNNLGGIYYNKGEWDKALEYYLKSEKILIEVRDRVGLAYTYFNIGSIYLENNEKEKANNYLILAGYITKTLDMKHELTQMAWALDLLINELGKEKFMEIGKKLYEERGI